MQKTTLKKAKTTTRTSVDWDVIRQKIDAANQKLASSEEINPEALEKAWARRSAQIAHKIQEENQGEMIQAAIISLDGERYGLDVQNIFDIRVLERITFVQRVPAWVLGVVNWRGRILSVIDLRRFLGLAANGAENKNKNTQRLIVLQAGEMEISIQADEVFAIESIPLSKINREDGGVRTIKAELVNGLYTNQQGIVVLLNLPALLADPRLIIREEIL